MAIGGARECLFVEPGLFNVILERRLGFVRIALETGASLVGRKSKVMYSRPVAISTPCSHDCCLFDFAQRSCFLSPTIVTQTSKPLM